MSGPYEMSGPVEEGESTEAAVIAAAIAASIGVT